MRTASSLLRWVRRRSIVTSIAAKSSGVARWAAISAICNSIGRRASTISESSKCLSGPAIVEQTDTTTVIPPGVVALVDEVGNLRLRRAP